MNVDIFVFSFFLSFSFEYVWVCVRWGGALYCRPFSLCSWCQHRESHLSTKIYFPRRTHVDLVIGSWIVGPDTLTGQCGKYGGLANTMWCNITPRPAQYFGRRSWGPLTVTGMTPWLQVSMTNTSTPPTTGGARRPRRGTRRHARDNPFSPVEPLVLNGCFGLVRKVRKKNIWVSPERGWNSLRWQWLWNHQSFFHLFVCFSFLKIKEGINKATSPKGIVALHWDSGMFVPEAFIRNVSWFQQARGTASSDWLN